jgi:hypothetical protein
VYNTTSAALVEHLMLMAEPVGNDTANTSARLSLLSAVGNTTPAETGLSISNKGLLTFAAGQTFPGTIAGATAGTDLSGGGLLAYGGNGNFAGGDGVDSTGGAGPIGGSGIRASGGQTTNGPSNGVGLLASGYKLAVTSAGGNAINAFGGEGNNAGGGTGVQGYGGSATGAATVGSPGIWTAAGTAHSGGSITRAKPS